ncbi:PREDICTED: Werner Syndrome-like exonuclease isoform X2 [Vollenhovia emeryi]|uniref:Werner Syndrome-like exonuclease isoform X2 n=1 Tax=Vollenhovia emeryi TaxID=411798 RepID=UPI0005F3BFAF|nr:PREDICTED: Werner Syndrome-like exonuclease isoform X2 [Vollenhovia emeryi]
MKRASTSDPGHRSRFSRTADPSRGVDESARLLSTIAMTTRATRLGRKEKKLEQPKPEREPDVNTLPAIVFKGRIQYADDFFSCAQICDDLIQEVRRSEREIVPVGFDLEWPFSFQTGSGKTALAQICLDNSVCYLLYVYSLRKLPAAFVELLCHPKVKLVGVNIKNDVRKLGRDFKEFPAQKVVENNCLDCGPYANQVLNRSCRWSLERLTAYLLKKKISKDPKVRMSRWHVQPLSDAQKSYAATDAYVSLLLYTTIHEKTVAIEKENQNVENRLNPSI